MLHTLISSAVNLVPRITLHKVQNLSSFYHCFSFQLPKKSPLVSNLVTENVHIWPLTSMFILKLPQFEHIWTTYSLAAFAQLSSLISNLASNTIFNVTVTFAVPCTYYLYYLTTTVTRLFLCNETVLLLNWICSYRYFTSCETYYAFTRPTEFLCFCNKWIFGCFYMLIFSGYKYEVFDEQTTFLPHL